ncbi:MAG: GNAT family N-acetyltransferase [Clostridia bacterium]|nr:GNAT family N-acetyltransferase [Clostridia bacterium]
MNDELIIRQAVPDDYEAVVDFYYDIIDHQDEREFGTKWTKDVYPSRGDIRTDIDKGFMHIGLCGGRIACAMAVAGNDEIYNDVEWPTEAEEDQVSVIHLLAVHNDFSCRGFAKKLVNYAKDLSRALGRKVIRLDVLKGNLPAEKLYLKCGFRFVAEKKIFYEDTGLADFRMFELTL